MTGILPIRSVMTPFPHSVKTIDSLVHAQALMEEHQIRHLAVTEEDRLVGVLTDRDLKRVLDPSLGFPSKEKLLVRDVFVADVYVVEGGESLDLVLEQMARKHIGSARGDRCGARGRSQSPASPWASCRRFQR